MQLKIANLTRAGFLFFLLTSTAMVAPTPRPFVKKWTMDELVPVVEKGLTGRDFDKGRELFAATQGTAFIVEVPLLFEKGLENWFDFTVCVATDSETQLRRLEQRGIPREQARKRLTQQLPLARKCELADHVLLNDGTPEFLREQVDALADRLLKSQSDRSAGPLHVSPP